MTVLDSLKATTLFKDLDQESLESIASTLKSRKLAKGEILFNKLDSGNEMYIVQEGAIVIYAPQTGSPANGQVIREFKAGETLGEMAIIDRQPRSLSARAETDTTLLALGIDDFHRVISKDPVVSIAVMGSLNDRIRYTTSFLGEVGQAVKRVSEGNYQVDEALIARTTDQDRSLADLARVFVEMAANIKKREETLRTEVARLQIEIDDIKRKKDVAEIVESDFYKELKEKIKKLREES